MAVRCRHEWHYGALWAIDAYASCSPSYDDVHFTSITELRAHLHRLVAHMDSELVFASRRRDRRKYNRMRNRFVDEIEAIDRIERLFFNG